MMARILIMAGGTGGHVFPALAVADELHSRAVEIYWMGTEKGIEAKLVPASGYPINYISVQGLRGNGLLGWLLAPFRILKAVIEAITVIRKIKPDVVLGLGGFASGPGGLAARLLGKPLAIHEQNAIPGMTNKLLSRIAQKAMEGFPDSFVESVKAEWVGNPVRANIEQMKEPNQRFVNRSGAIHILVLGGSLGAKALNIIVPQAIALLEQGQRPVIRHQCGQHHLSDCKDEYKHANVTAEVTTFINDMAESYAWADLVICRAGALTIAELSAAGVGALLVPYPYAVDDHQTHNAAALVTAGAAHLLPEQILTPQLLCEEIRLMSDREHLLTMANAARTQAKLGSASVIADRCMELVHG